IRSGGHDVEGVSYVSQVPFVILDLVNFRDVNVDTKNEVAWVQSGATTGELYYGIASKTQTLGFPAGGGGNTFGVVLAWKIKLVPVPPVVTVFTVNKNLEQNATKTFHRWQYIAHKLSRDLFTTVWVMKVNSSQVGRKTVLASFKGMFLGRIDVLIPLIQYAFPELGLARENCTEMSWVQSVLYFGALPIEPVEILLNRSALPRLSLKAKTDYIREPMSETGIEGFMNMFLEEGTDFAITMIEAFGGKMDEIRENEIPFPHRSGILFESVYIVQWRNEEDAGLCINWIRRLYSYMSSYASKSLRGAYYNYKDLDLGTNNINGYTSYEQASVWGLKYFRNNFKRLVRIKTMIDPMNFFSNEQSIPPLLSP
ncbi:hypothetical protein Gotri_026846, partial [Gossypium trilobum]|nr:hypothetical protein [Gossypium trilobum]